MKEGVRRHVEMEDLVVLPLREIFRCDRKCLTYLHTKSEIINYVTMQSRLTKKVTGFTKLIGFTECEKSGKKGVIGDQSLTLICGILSR